MFDNKWNIVRRFGSGILKCPTGIAIAPVGHSTYHVLVADISLHNINVFDENCKLLRQLDSFRGPEGLAERDGMLYVVEEINAVVQVLSVETGSFIRFIGVDKLKRPSGISLCNEELFVGDCFDNDADHGNYAIQVFNLLTGLSVRTIRQQFFTPRGIIATQFENGTNVVVPSNDYRCLVLDADGKLVKSFNSPFTPFSVAYHGGIFMIVGVDAIALIR